MITDMPHFTFITYTKSICLLLDHHSSLFWLFATRGLFHTWRWNFHHTPNFNKTTEALPFPKWASWRCGLTKLWHKHPLFELCGQRLPHCGGCSGIITMGASVLMLTDELQSKLY